MAHKRRLTATTDGAPVTPADTMRLYADIVQHSELAIWVWQRTDTKAPNWRVALANPAAAHQAGLEPEAAIGKLTSEACPALATSEVLARCLAVLQSEGTDSLELRFGLERYEEVVLAVKIFAMPSDCVGVVVEDITNRRHLEEQLHLRKRLETIGRLAGGVAHDFNNLLTVVLGYAALLQERMSDPSMREDVNEIKTAAERAAALVAQLLAFGRKQVLQPVILEINPLVANLDRMLQRVLGEPIALVTRLSPHAGRVRADPGQLEQVILNLAVNARDAMPKGGKLTIETTNVEMEEEKGRQHFVAMEPGAYVMIAISDSGVGMDDPTRQRVFEPFFTTKDKGRGTGLGLATVYGTIKQSGGFIWVYSEPGIGSTFKVYMPRVDAPADAPAAAASGAVIGGTETILLVEDNDMVRKIAEQALLRQGYRLLVAPDAEEAERLVRSYPETIHLLLTDIVLGGVSGRQLADIVAPLRPEMGVIYMSGYAHEAIVHHGTLEAGTAFLQKPFTASAIARKVREVLDRMSS